MSGSPSPAIDGVIDIFTYCFISFYPFCAIFSLYEHILECLDPHECEQDMIALEHLGVAMELTAAQRPEFAAFAKTIKALNTVSRTMQDERQKASQADSLSEDQADTSVNVPPTFNFDMFQDLVPDFDISNAFHLSEGQQQNDPNNLFHPSGFVRALENDFMGRNWSEASWDVTGEDLDGTMVDLSENTE
jgi:hypothetical protein